MIDDLDRTIRELLNQELPRVQAGQVDVAFFPPNREWRREGSALNFFLYDVRQNAILRQHQRYELLENGQHSLRTDNRVPLQRKPLRLDCFYMVTAWSTDPVDEHRLLTECLAALARYPLLNRYETLTEAEPTDAAVSAGSAPAPVPTNVQRNGASYLQRPLVRDFLVGALRNLTYEIPARIADHDVMTNPAELWSTLENSMKAAFSYVVTLPLTPWLPFTEREVDTATFIFGPTALKQTIDPATGKPKDSGELTPIVPVVERTLLAKTPWPVKSQDQLVAIGGLVRDALRNGAPVADITVQVKATGLQTQTNAEGRFHFPHLWLHQAEITLIVDPDGPQQTEKTVRLPLSKEENYHVTINIVSEKPPKKPEPPTPPKTTKPTGKSSKKEG